MKSGSVIKAASDYHYTERTNRLSQPLVRKNGDLTPATWDEALDLVAGEMSAAGERTC